MNQKGSFLGTLLKTYRKEQCPKWSQEKMANHLGISIKTYRKIERGEQEYIPLSALLLVMDHFDIQNYGIEKGDNYENFSCDCKK